MSNMNNPLSSISYTNKDFQTIYPELLEAAKMLAKNWDPTISNESDPGVVLLKLSAIIGDKNNYNIDKNILENYPETYTQDISARSQYRQLGYKMPWYRAATCPVIFRWVGESLSVGQYITIPKYTLLTDSSAERVFTLLEDVTLSKKEYNSSMMSTGKVMQGVVNRLSITGSDVITLSHLDKNNRLYINASNVAENGVFIYSADSNKLLWTQVYNVDTQYPGSTCYEFDVDQRKNCPYIQFPNDIYSTIGSGLIVEYITTDGHSGNVSAKSIDSYLNESTLTIKSIDLSVEHKEIPLNTNNIKVHNPYATTDVLASMDINIGKDPETIEEARLSYKKLVGTFDTLVTLRDYMNAIYSMNNPELISNVIVTDRTNDIQSAYKIVSKYPSIFNTITYMTGDTKYTFKQDDSGEYVRTQDGTFSLKSSSTEEGEAYSLQEDRENDMSPFDLKLYLLKSGGIVSTLDSYDDTFLVDNSPVTKMRIEAKLEDMKSVQHDFVDIKPDLPFMLQAVYPITLKIIPAYKLDDMQQAQVGSNIISALRELLNSRKCEFGVEPDYDVIYNKISSCDERIKIIIMDDFKYTLFAVYLDGKTNEFKYVPISDYSTCDRIISATGKDDQDKDDVKAILDEKLQNLDVAEDLLKDFLFVDTKHGILYTAELEERFNDITGRQEDSARSLSIYSDRLQEIRKEIIAKNILAGVTPLYEVSDDKFVTTLDMQQVSSDNVHNLSTNLEIHPFGIDTPYDPNKRDAVYTLKKNETVRCLAPSFVMEKSFSSYTKFEVVLANPITRANSYIAADPSKEAEIIKRYGYESFYAKTGTGSHIKKTSDAYLKIESTPRYKLDSYYYDRASGQSILREIIRGALGTPLSSEDAVLRAAVRTKYTFDFEPYLYYTKNNGRFEVLSSYPYGQSEDDSWGINYYKSCYKLRQYVELAADESLYMPLEDFVVNRQVLNQEVFNKLVENRLFIDSESGKDLYTEYKKAYESLGLEENHEQLSLYVKVTPEELASVNDADTFRNNLEASYIQLGAYGSDVYRVIRENPLNKESKILGYEMVMLNEEASGYELTRYVTGGEYIEVTYPTVWSTDNYSIRYFDNTSDTETGVKFSEIHYIPSIPDTVYKLNKDKYEEVDVTGTEWAEKFGDYYTLKPFSGVHPSSQEYLDWISGRTVLYVPEVTYKIPADSEYQLRKGDSVKFFWRDKDEDDAPYNYECYKGTDDEYSNPIIKANFTVTAKAPGDEFVSARVLEKSGTIPYDNSPNSNFSRVASMYGDDDLGASRQLDIRRINQVRMVIDGECKNRFYYVVTNNKVKVNDKLCYKLVLNRVSTKEVSGGKTTHRYKHALQPDEYFFYVNEDKTLFAVLGEGTLIDYTITTDRPMDNTLEFVVEAVDTFDISFKGISVFKDNCKEITKEEDIRLIEQQVYSFSEGDSIQLSLKSSVDYTYDKATAYLPGTKYYQYEQEFKAVTPMAVNSVEYTAPQFILNHYYKKYEDEYELLVDKPDDWDAKTVNQDGSVSYSCSNYYIRAGKEYKEVTDEVNESNYQNYYIQIAPEYPVISTDNSLLLDEVDIYYSTSGSASGQSSTVDKAFSQLPIIDVTDDEYKWSVTSYLNISTSPDTPQRIPASDRYTKCSVTVNKMTYPNGDSDEIDSSKDLYLLTDIPIERTGGNNVDVSWSNLLGEVNSVKVFSYQINPVMEDSNKFNKTSDTIKFNIDANEGEIEGEIEIDGIKLDNQCMHILPIKLLTDGLSVRIFTKSSKEEDYAQIGCICCDDTDIHTMGKHFISLRKSTTHLKIHYKLDTEVVDASAIEFHQLFKYKYRDLFGGESSDITSAKYGLVTSDMEAEVRRLDIPREFDYCYLTTVDSRILDPLDPVSVFDSNHVFNKFSIQRADLRTVIPHGTSIDFVNNR